MKKPIHKFSLGHCLLRSYVDIFSYLFYKEITIVGKENVPHNEPVILAPNHQNALMDAMAILYTLKRQPVFMARSDIFKKPKQAKILRFFKILPIYRIRDGIQSLHNNDAVFLEAVDVLEHNKRLVILPEGNHFGQRRLRPLKKGIARIALLAEERKNFELGVKIIPVGIDYTHYINFGSRLCVSFGEPFEVKKYKEEYLENPQKAMNSLMEELRERMIPQIVHLDHEEDYDAIEYLKDIYIAWLYKGKHSSAKHWRVIEKSQQFSDQIKDLSNHDQDAFQKLKEAVEPIKTTILKHNLRTWAVIKDNYPVWKLVVGRLLQVLLLPVFIIGYITNIIPFYLPVYLARKVKDPQFLSSFRFVLSIITFTVTYLLYLAALLIFVPKTLLALAIFVSIPFWGLGAFKYYIWFMKNTARWKVNRLNRSKDADWLQLLEKRNFILSVFIKLIADGSK